MTEPPPEMPDGRRQSGAPTPAIADPAGHLSKTPRGEGQGTTLLVAHVEGQDRPRAMVLSPDAVLRLLTQSRGRVVHLTTATDIDDAVAGVQAIRSCVTRTAPRTAPLPAGGTAPLPTDVTLTGGTAV